MRPLIDEGADVKARTDDGATQQWIAVYDGHVTVVEVLLAKDADANICDEDECSPLYTAYLPEGQRAVRLGPPREQRFRWRRLRVARTYK